MGQTAVTGTREENVDSETSDDPNVPKEKDLQFLLGKLEDLPDSARRLFSLGKQYLTTGSNTDGATGDNFSSLFQVYQPNSSQNSHENATDSNTDSDTNLHAPRAQTNLLNTPVPKSAPLYHFQTFIQWKAAQDLHNFYSMCMPKRQTIYVRPIGELPDFVQSFRFESGNMNLGLLETIQAFLQVYFCGLEVLLQPPVSIDEAVDKVRSRLHPVTGQTQICITDLYPFLQRLLPQNGICVMGISWMDLYPEGHNFALGEASPQHKSAVISFGRFEPREYDVENPRDVLDVDAHLMWKFLKSSSHELCHILGLQHCSFFDCAMNESTSVAEAMSQPLFLCPVCLRKLQQACRFDVLERYVLLRRFLSSLVEKFPYGIMMQDSIKWLDRCIDFLNS